MTPTVSRRLGFGIVVAVALLTAGCGGSQSSDTASGTPDQQRPTDRVTIDITIEGGKVTPTNAQVPAKLNEPIVLRVNSDAADELHVHSVPEHTFKVAPKPGQQFQFSVEVPGNVEIELHELNRVVATVQVQQ
ncbi:hypothetical protein QGN32_10645 [Mycolicibacterium sp. ND9-15]|uniref:hypothetical protein n=1 Tax=Mycolicibacterium sp. ND9-15 TaxID=3042320 RepID=UPI002DDC8399|nr:hypothetical protein [Mycolicibacterium sp. ND9-15]WSE58262.1 hypothetical protein QGN32_10645 [Mycolicibacterium sp. ND9-15]